jgi:hypothetical protein
MKNCGADDTYITSLDDFCRDVVTRVRAWAESVKNDPLVQKNAANLMKFYPNGLPPVGNVPSFA